MPLYTTRLNFQEWLGNSFHEYFNKPRTTKSSSPVWLKTQRPGKLSIVRKGCVRNAFNELIWVEGPRFLFRKQTLEQFPKP